jgi:hypothetical protein
VATEHQGKGDHAKAKEYWQKDQEHSRPADEHSKIWRPAKLVIAMMHLKQDFPSEHAIPLQSAMRRE